ncbi:TPA: competence protein ComGG [Streptococcus suis]|nr:competence protein ComGG [Streptococcus suis]
MLLKKKVKAGILLYALLMLAVFSLLLQFYLHRQEAESRLVQVARQETTAYIMAQMVLDKVEGDLQERQAVAEKTIDEKEEKEAQPTRKNQETTVKSELVNTKKKEGSKPIETEGSVLFREGQTSYHIKNRTVSVNVNLRNGGEYHYQFPVKIVPEGSG